MIDTTVPYFEMSWDNFVGLSIPEYNELSCYYDFDVKREMNKTIVFWTIKLKPGKEIKKIQVYLTIIYLVKPIIIKPSMLFSLIAGATPLEWVQSYCEGLWLLKLNYGYNYTST